MTTADYSDIFSQESLSSLFPPDRSDAFFEALYGDAQEGAYNIRFVFSGNGGNQLKFEFHLEQRNGKCLVCNLTYGLPEVFRRHPIINIKGLVQGVEKLLKGKATCSDWRLGSTREISHELHIIPLIIQLAE